MNILLLSIGTRGDMEPFFAVGYMLKEKGHRVTAACPEQFRHLAETAGISFHSLGTEFIALLESETGKSAMGGSAGGLKKFIATLKLAAISTAVNKALLIRQREIIEQVRPDRIVYNGKAVYPLIWELTHPGKTVLISPVPYVHYVRDHAHVAFSRNFGPLLNKWSYGLASFGLVTTVMISKKWLGIDGIVTRDSIRSVLRNNKAVYTISPLLFPRPEYWPDTRKVLGYHTLPQPDIECPDKALERFLNRHDRILFITFGSMLNTSPEKKTRTLISILEKHRIPTIINTASGGLIEPPRYDRELIRFVSRVPYSWILPGVYAVIHHGGSGTTQLALAHGCPSMIIPHIIDQFVWNGIVYRMGAGPEGMHIDKLDAIQLEKKLLDLLHNPTYKIAAEQIAADMSRENYREELCTFITGD